MAKAGRWHSPKHSAGSATRPSCPSQPPAQSGEGKVEAVCEGLCEQGTEWRGVRKGVCGASGVSTAGSGQGEVGSRKAERVLPPSTELTAPSQSHQGCPVQSPPA